MAFISATDAALLHAAIDNNITLAAGITRVGETTISGYELVSSADELEFLALTVGRAGGYNPLPAMGEPVEAGVIYSYEGSLVIARQSHTRTEHDPADVPALFIVWREDADDVLQWIAGEQVHVGTRRIYQDVVYECIQAHVTQSDWTPPAVPALWVVVPDDAEPGEWQPNTAYVIDDIVTYQGITYRCRQSHTSQVGWEPPNVLALWEPVP
jgi:hypothetical protein